MPTTQHSSQVVISFPESNPSTTTNEKKQPVYRRNYDHTILLERAMQWYNSVASTRALCPKDGPLPRQTFERHLKKSNLKKMKKEKAPPPFAKLAFEKYLDGLQFRITSRTKIACATNRYLTDDEELSVVELIRLFASMGFGIGVPQIREIIDEIVNFDEPDICRVECSEKVLRRIMKIYPDLYATMASSLDPQRALKATKEVRDAMFMKLDAYIKNLHAAGKVDWESYEKIPNYCIYNMDEVGLDSTKHRNKIICSSLNNISRHFQRTPEGDNKMNMHITCCLTTCADGELLLVLFWLVVVIFVVHFRRCHPAPCITHLQKMICRRHPFFFLLWLLLLLLFPLMFFG